jgi:hypothetical protein
MTFRITIALILGGLAVWLPWDVVAATNKIVGDTISEITARYSHLTALLPVALGVVSGHLMSQGWDFMPPVVEFIRNRPLIGFTAGVAIGLFCWNQGPWK